MILPFCIGEYTTKTNHKKNTWTRQFCYKDIIFSNLSKQDQLMPLPPNVSVTEILTAKAVALYIP